MKYRIKDGARAVEFDGEKLAESTSDDGKAQRWTDLTLYRTNSGLFVIHRVGRSVVYHAQDSRCTRQAQPTLASLLTADPDYIACRKCNPPDIYSAPQNVTVLVEQDRHAAIISETARGVVDVLHGKDGNGTLFMTHTARQLIEEASRVNNDIRQAWEVQRV